jgi:hypothetical protein
MPMQWQVEDASDHLVIRAEGEWHSESVLKMIDDGARAARESGHTRILIDCRNVHGHFAENDRYLAGVRIGERLRDIRVAVLGSEEVHINRRGLNAALRRGVEMIVTKDMEEALQWLAQ